MVLECGARQFRLNDGAFLAADTSLEIKIKNQGIGQALLGGSGQVIVASRNKVGFAGWVASLNGQSRG